MAKSNEQVVQEFDEAVNMTRKELEEWLQTDESKSVGQSDGGGESKGHKSGRKILQILDKNKTDYSSDDIDHMRRVVSYVHRHESQKTLWRCEGQQLALLFTQLGSRSLEVMTSETTSRRPASPPRWSRHAPQLTCGSR